MTNRPLSPHLQVYRPQLTSILSVTHRASGIFLSLGIPFFVYWLWALESGPEAFARAQAYFGGFIGRTLLLFWSMAFFYHLCNGIRHLFWDAGKGFELEDAYRSGWAVVVAAASLTLLSWIGAYATRGAF